jgi:hypothetical protein
MFGVTDATDFVRARTYCSMGRSNCVVVQGNKLLHFST